MFSISAVCAQLDRPGFLSLSSILLVATCTPHTYVDRLDTDFILDRGSFCSTNKETQLRK
jgi:hypothetical protein